MKKYTQDELEELDLVECCKHCYGIGLKQEKEELYCPNCGATNYTTIITMNEWEKLNEVKC